MARSKTANPVLDGVVDAPPAAPAPQATRRVRVRLKDGGPARRHRGGIAFIRQWVELDVAPAVLEALQADPWLTVEER